MASVSLPFYLAHALGHFKAVASRAAARAPAPLPRTLSPAVDCLVDAPGLS
ncbi:MAG: hypothetical protein AAFU80_25260 [Pseudomonadota bacterium]